jgi:hypothetical protein
VSHNTPKHFPNKPNPHPNSLTKQHAPQPVTNPTSRSHPKPDTAGSRTTAPWGVRGARPPGSAPRNDRVRKGEAQSTPRNGGPPRQGEERGGRRGSPQALTGGVSALRLLHELGGWASGSGKFPRGVSLRAGVTFVRVVLPVGIGGCAALSGAWPQVHSPGGCVWRPALASLAAKLL